MKADLSEPVVPFRGVGALSEEIFGKIRRDIDPPIKDLLSWQETEIQDRPLRVLNKNPDWVSESHAAFKSYMVASAAQGRPYSAFNPKPIEDPEARPPKSGSPKGPGDKVQKGGYSGSPKAAKKGKKVPKTAETPKSGKNASERQLERLKKLNQTTRWLPNSAFKTYFGKPVFANYGQGNTNPAYGGLMYGDYMKTHNIAPHEGANNPQTQQVYEIAEIKALQKQSKPQIVPRKCRDEDRLPPEEVDKLKKRSLILAKSKNKPSKEIIKPNLLEEKLFKSEHGTPNASEGEDEPVIRLQPKTEKVEKTVKNEEKVEKSGKNYASKEKPEDKRLKIENRVNNVEDKKGVSGSKPGEPVLNKGNKNGLSKMLAGNPQVEPQELHEAEENSELPENAEEKEDPEGKSQDADVQAEDCNECNRNMFSKLVRTSYQDMTSKMVVNKNNQVIEPYKYCARCRDCLYNDDVLRPPYSLGEIPPQELDPKNYKTLPPQWTQRIPAAGKLSYRSPSAYQVIFGENQPLGGFS